VRQGARRYVVGEVAPFDQKNEMFRRPVWDEDLLALGGLEFRPITAERYPVWQIREALLDEPRRGVVVNAANEAAIRQFVEGRIGFLDISKQVIEAFERYDTIPRSIDEVFALDREIRERSEHHA